MVQIEVHILKRCGSHLYVEGLEIIEGDYFVFGDSLYGHRDWVGHEKPLYYNERKKMYLYYHDPRWYFGSTLGAGMFKPTTVSRSYYCHPFCPPVPYCPSGHIYHIRNPEVKSEYIKGPDISVTVVDNRTTTRTVTVTTTIPSNTTQRSELAKLLRFKALPNFVQN